MGFLADLAAMARGEPIAGAAQPMLAPRFAWRSQAVDERAPLQREGGVEQESDPVPDRQTLAALEQQARAGPPTAAHSTDERSYPPAFHGSGARDARNGTQAAPPVVRSAAPSHPVAPPSDRPPVFPKAATQEDRPKERELEWSRAPTAPLSNAALAVRPPRERDAGPIVHVSIDSIDLRAPEPAPRNAPPKPARTPPRASLSDYLRSSDARGRP